MNKKTLDRLRALAGNEVPVEAPKDESRKNMYQIMESLDVVTEGEVSSCCGANIDSHDGKFGRCMACGEMAGVEHEDDFEDDLSDRERPQFEDRQSPATEQEQMREWANSVYHKYEDRGMYQEQPEGETVDLSLRRYLNAKAEPVQIEEDIQSKDMLREYKKFKKND